MSSRGSRSRDSKPVRGGGRVPLNRALSKLGILSRAQASAAIRDGRVRVNGAVIRRPLALVDPDHIRIAVDERERSRAAWRTILFHKPRGVLTTRHDPQGRPTIYDVLGDDGRGLIAVGRLDQATSGLLLLTSDTRLAARLTDPVSAIPRVYVVTIRGRVSADELRALMDGVDDRGDRLRAESVTLRKASGRESHLIVELREGKNREVRRLFETIGHQVTRLRRVRLGGLELGSLAPGAWRELTHEEIRAAFPSIGGRSPVL